VGTPADGFPAVGRVRTSCHGGRVGRRGRSDFVLGRRSAGDPRSVCGRRRRSCTSLSRRLPGAFPVAWKTQSSLQFNRRTSLSSAPRAACVARTGSCLAACRFQAPCSRETPATTASTTTWLPCVARGPESLCEVNAHQRISSSSEASVQDPLTLGRSGCHDEMLGAADLCSITTGYRRCLKHFSCEKRVPGGPCIL
jgi:hypothetical protein